MSGTDVCWCLLYIVVLLMGYDTKGKYSIKLNLGLWIPSHSFMGPMGIVTRIIFQLLTMAHPLKSSRLAAFLGMEHDGTMISPESQAPWAGAKRIMQGTGPKSNSSNSLRKSGE